MIKLRNAYIAVVSSSLIFWINAVLYEWVYGADGDELRGLGWFMAGLSTPFALLSVLMIFALRENDVYEKRDRV